MSKQREFWLNVSRQGYRLFKEWPPKEETFTIGPIEVIHLKEVNPAIDLAVQGLVEALESHVKMDGAFEMHCHLCKALATYKAAIGEK